MKRNAKKVSWVQNITSPEREETIVFAQSVRLFEIRAHGTEKNLFPARFTMVAIHEIREEAGIQTAE